MAGQEDDGGEVTYVHHACGFPIYQDAEGKWHHVEAADGVFCSMFNGGEGPE